MGHATATTLTGWATQEDWTACRDLHRNFGPTYFFASKFFPFPMRRRVDAVYGFVRVPNEWVRDQKVSEEEARDRLRVYRRELQEGLEGRCPDQPVLRAFVDMARESGMALNEPFLFLEAMEADLSAPRYQSYADLERSMRGSAAAVGLMLIDVLGIQRTPVITEGAMALAEAIQLTNILRSVGDDLIHGRIYLPIEDMDRFGIVEEDLYNRRVSSEFIELMRFEITRARDLYATADLAIPELPKFAQRPVRFARVLYSRTLNRIEAAGYDVFYRRAQTGTFETAAIAGRAILRR